MDGTFIYLQSTSYFERDILNAITMYSQIHKLLFENPNVNFPIVLNCYRLIVICYILLKILLDLYFKKKNQFEQQMFLLK